MKLNQGTPNEAVIGVEFANGEPARFNSIMRDILKAQDFNEWRHNPAGFNDWLSLELSRVVRENMYFRIKSTAETL